MSKLCAHSTAFSQNVPFTEGKTIWLLEKGEDARQILCLERRLQHWVPQRRLCPQGARGGGVTSREDALGTCCWIQSGSYIWATHPTTAGQPSNKDSTSLPGQRCQG